MKKLVLGGKEYTVVGEGVENKKRVIELRGARGGKYMFIQNHPNPKAWFLMAVQSPQKVRWYYETTDGKYTSVGTQW